MKLDEVHGKGVLIHHWDTDGICSARLLLEKLSGKNIDNYTPTLGNYFLTEEEVTRCSSYDFVIVADMSLPEENILRLADNARQVMIFDHHLGKEIKQVFHHNPVIKGGDPAEYPSASWIVNEYLGNTVNLFALLGVVGDHEQKITDNTVFYDKIQRFCQQHDVSFDDMLQMVYLLDSNYKVGDKEAVEKAPHTLRDRDAQDILQDEQWNNNLSSLEQEMEQQLSKKAERINGILLKKMDTPFNIISTVTRRIAWNTGKDTVVVNTGFFDDVDQIYVRSNGNLQEMIQRGKEYGFKCGGKHQVMGALVPKDKTDSFLEEIIAFLRED